MNTAVTSQDLTARWRSADRRHHLHPFTDYKDLNARGSLVITRAEGVYIWDSEGKRYLDGMAGLWCTNVGYGRTELIDAAVHQLRELPYYNTFFQTTHPPAAELSSLLAEVAPAGLGRVFYTNSGSEAADTALRAVRRYWELAGKPAKSVVISRKNAYHGSTMGGASLGGMAPIHAQGGLPIPDIVHIRQPYWYAEGGELTPDAFGLEAARALERKIEELGEERVAAFVAEPIQGAGGVIVPPASYWPEISRICRERDILLVVDEVICGFGRTGKWFGSHTYDLRPDLMLIAKGLSSGYLPIGGVMVSDRVAEVLIERGGEFQHGFTYSGHPTCCAVAIANVRLLRDEGIVDRAGADIGPYFQSRLRELVGHRLVGEVRGVGLIAGIQLAKGKASRTRFTTPSEAGKRCRTHSIENGLVMRAVEDSMVLSPPLVITRAEVDELVDKVTRSLDQTAAEVLA